MAVYQIEVIDDLVDNGIVKIKKLDGFSDLCIQSRRIVSDTTETVVVMITVSKAL